MWENTGGRSQLDERRGEKNRELIFQAKLILTETQSSKNTSANNSENRKQFVAEGVWEAGTWRPAVNCEGNTLEELVGRSEKVGSAEEETGNGAGMKRKGDVFNVSACYGLKCGCSKARSAFQDTPCLFCPFS